MIVVVTIVAFLLIHLAPGEPFAYEGRNVTPAARGQWRERFGYNRPLPVQLAKYVGNVLRGQFGYSTLEHRPAVDAIADAMPRTLLLAAIGLTAAIILGIGAGALAASGRGTWRDRIISLGFVCLYSIPEFWLALILQLGLAYWLRLFPVSGTADPLIADYGTRSAAFVDRLRHLALPSLALTLVLAAVIGRFQRAALLDVLPSDYLRTARAKGASERTVLARHALRNALTPTITILGYVFPTILGGVFFIEYVFGWSGLGLLTVRAVQALDYDVATATVIIAGVLVTLGNLLADIGVAAADPRVRDA